MSIENRIAWQQQRELEYGTKLAVLKSFGERGASAAEFAARWKPEGRRDRTEAEALNFLRQTIREFDAVNLPGLPYRVRAVKLEGHTVY